MAHHFFARWIALGADAFKDGFGDSGVDPEPRWLEPLPPLAQVEEPEHSGPLAALAMMRVVLRGDGRYVSGPREGPVADDEHPTAYADRERGRDQHAEGEQERGLSVHEPRQGTRAFRCGDLGVVWQGIFKTGARRADNDSKGTGRPSPYWKR